jgi:hypothetical protein
LILTNPDQPESIQVAGLVEAALRREANIAGLPQIVSTLRFETAEGLAAEIKRRSSSIVYLTPGLDAPLESICKAVQPFSVLTITTSSDYVRRCAVLGMQVVAGRPRILIHLAHAQRSGIRFRTELLELATVLR